jgi:alanyl-tRNA synthetase
VVVGKVTEWQERLRGAPAIQLTVASAHRQPVRRHHTATHLLHAALRQVLGDHVEQAGSEVSPQKLRFDYRHDAPLDRQEIERIEEIVNGLVLANQPVIAHVNVPIAEARARGAMALFGEKYGDNVRMIEIPTASEPAAEPAGENAVPPYSLELCGGTHCERTGDIGLFRVVAESSSAAGVRRIEAVAGERALELVRQESHELAALSEVLRRDGGPFAEQVRTLRAERDRLHTELQRSNQRAARDSLEQSLAGAETVGDLKVVAAQVSAEDRDSLMQLGDHMRDKLGRGVVILAAEWGGKATLITTVTADLIQEKRFHAGEIVKAIVAKVGGRGGGRPHMAQAGLPEPSQIPAALAAAIEVVKAHDS